MSNIFKGIKLNEADPRNFDSDIDYYNALNKKPRSRSEDDYVEPPDDEPIRFQQKPDARPQYSISKDEDRQVGYNMTLTVKAPTTQKAQWAAESYVDSEWGAKKQIGDIQTVADGVVQVHMIDNHKHGYWKPWADEPPISKGIEFNESAIIGEANKLLESLSSESRTSVINELSNELLGRYKKAAGADASAADKRGDYKRGDKRFSSIVKATKKEFDNDTKGVSEASPETTFNLLKGLKTWQVVIMNNYYRGKYSDYSGRYYYVLATSPEEARQVVLDNADAILQDLLSMKSVNGKKILPRGSAIAITDKRIGDIQDGTEAGRMTTAGYKKMFSPQGVMMVKLSGGEVVDVQGQEQGVAEGYDKWGWHTSVVNGEFMSTKYGNKNYVYLHDMDNQSANGSPQLVTVNKPTVAKRIAQQFGGKVVKTDLNTYRIVKPAEQGVAEGLSKGNYNVGLEDIGKPVTVDGESGYVLLSIGYSSGNGKLTAHILQPDTGSKGTYDLETIGKGQQGVAEAIPYALSAANANAEFERLNKNRTSSMPAGGGYRGRVELDVESREDYIATGRTLKKAAEAAGQHIEYGLSDGVMKVFSDSMTSDELDAFIDDTLEQGLAEDQLDEKWTKKYKDSINCSNPKGFSQKAHCAGKQKNESAIMKGLK